MQGSGKFLKGIFRKSSRGEEEGPSGLGGILVFLPLVSLSGTHAFFPVSGCTLDEVTLQI